MCNFIVYLIISKFFKWSQINKRSNALIKQLYHMQDQAKYNNILKFEMALTLSRFENLVLFENFGSIQKK